MTVSIDLDEQVNAIRSRADFVSFVHVLRQQLGDHPDWWENADLESFLDALSRWVEDMDGYYRNAAQPIPTQPSWKVLGDILMAAATYE
jgi:hypothetical protein